MNLIHRMKLILRLEYAGFAAIYFSMLSCAFQDPVPVVNPLEFEPILADWWDEGPVGDSSKFCGPERNLHRHVFAEDGKSVTWLFERPLDNDGRSKYRYLVVGANSVSLSLTLEGESRNDQDGVPLVWELVIVDDGFFRWRAASFPVGTYNPVVGRRCREAIILDNFDSDEQSS